MMEKNKLKYYIYNIFYDCDENIDNLFVIGKTWQSIFKLVVIRILILNLDT